MKLIAPALAVLAVTGCAADGSCCGPAHPNPAAANAAFRAAEMQRPYYPAGTPSQQNCITMPNGLGGFNTSCR